MGKRSEAVNPMQPLLIDGNQRTRFKENKIVSHLLDWAQARGMGLNEIACLPFDAEDREQFAQLIGYSVTGYGELSYVSDESYAKAARAEKRLLRAARPKRKAKVRRGK